MSAVACLLLAAKKLLSKKPRVKPIAILVMYAVSIFSTIPLMPSSVHAASAGPRFAAASGNCVNDASAPGTVLWTSPGNAFSDDSLNATASVDGTTTRYIKCTNFGFTIPAAATIDGIVVNIERMASSTGNGGSNDAAMRLIKAGTVGTTDRSTSTTYTTTMVVEPHGNSTDLWGTTWTPNDVNASTFGAAFAASKPSAAGAAHTVSVDYISITVYYTVPMSYEQRAYRIFNNDNSTNVGAAMALTNTPATLTARNQNFRVRILNKIGLNTLAQNGETFSLQYAEKTTAACSSVPTGNYASLESTWTQATTAANWTDRFGFGFTTAVLNGKLWVMGGQDAGTYRNDVWSSTDGASWTQATAAAAWQGRAYYNTVAFNNKLWVMSGDSTSGDKRDVWSSSDGISWTQETASAGWTGRLGGAVAVFNNKLWMIGGQSGGVKKNDVWSSSDGINWTQETAAANWSARSGHAAVAFNNKLWVIGGNDGARKNDVWSSSDGITWISSPAPAWAARDYFASTSTGNKLWVSGGDGVSGRQDDVWYTTDGSNWTQITTLGGGPRSFASAAHHNGKLWIMGGTTNAGGEVNDVWSLDVSKPLEFFNNPNPGATNGAALTANANDPTDGASAVVNQTYVEGGNFSNSIAAINVGENGKWDFSLIDNAAPAGKTYCLRMVKSDGSLLNTYTVYPEITIAAPTYDQRAYRFFNNSNSTDVGTPIAASNTPITLPSANAAFRLRMLKLLPGLDLPVNGENFKLQYSNRAGYGGCSAVPSANYSDIGLTSWTQVTANAGWITRAGPGFEAFNNKLWVIGGGNRNDVWSSSDGVSWSQETANAGWTGRDPMTAVFNGKLWVMGGWNGAYFNDVWSSSTGASWTQETAAAGWSGRHSFGLVVFNNKMWVLGGTTASGGSNEVWSTSDGVNWIRETANAGWTGRGYLSATVYDNKIWIMGGGGARNDVWWSSDGISWTQATSAANWAGRDSPMVEVYNNRMYLMGGWSGNTKYNDVWTSTNGSTWTLQTTSVGWNGRVAPRSTFFNNRLWVTAGDEGSNNKNDVWSYIETPIGYNDNTTPANGAALTANANDPTDGAQSIVNQSYVENNTYTNSVAAIGTMQDGKWDFSLKDNNAPSSTTYCIRAVKSDGNQLNTYTQYPEVTTFGSNSPPAAPTLLAQNKVTGDTQIPIGGWTNENQVRLSATATDPDASDTLQLCVESKPLGTAFTGTGEVCGTGVAYSGTGVVVSVTITGLAENGHHWQARVKDLAGAYSSWVSYGANLESDRDYGVDTSPSTGTVYDGSVIGVDKMFNDGSLDTLAANWSTSSSPSGLLEYHYSIGTTPGGTNILGWTTAGTSTSLSRSSLALVTSQMYYFNVRVTDNAGNMDVLSSNGVLVAPTLTFTTSTSSIAMGRLNSGTNTTTQSVTLTTSTNALNGYRVYGKATDLLRNQSSQTLNMFSAGSYASPAAWGSNFGFGYNSSDNLVGGTNRFNSASCPGGGSAPCYAPYSLTGMGDIVADHSGATPGTPISNDAVTITNKVMIDSGNQASGNYQTSIMYSAYATY